MKAPAIVLLLAAMAAAVPAMPPASSPPEDDAPEKRGEDIKKGQEALDKTESALTLLKRGAWAASKVAGAAGLENVTEDLDKATEVLEPVEEAVSRLKEAVDRVADVADKSEGKEKAQNAANWFLDTLKLYRLDGQADVLEKTRRNIQDIPIGLVEADGRFKVSPDLVDKDPAEAKARFGEYLEAMETNIDDLNKLQSYLKDVQDTAVRTQGVESIAAGSRGGH